MSLALTHFAFGAAMTGIVLTIVYPRVRYSHTLLVLGGLWAMLPDTYHVWPRVAKHFEGSVLSEWLNLFWLHQFLDAADRGDSPEIAAVAVAFLLGVVFLLDSQRGETSEGRVAGTRGASDAGHPVDWSVRTAVGASFLVLGGLFGVVALVTFRNVGLLVGLSTLFGTSGLLFLAADDGVARSVYRFVTPEVLLGGKAVLTVTMGLLIYFLVTVPARLTPVTFAYGAVALLLATQLFRLWVPQGILASVENLYR